MRRDTLLDFFDDLASSSGTFLVYDDGFRTRQWTYAEVGHAAHAFASRLQAAGLSRGDKILLWGENRPEWIVAFWGAVLNGVAVVPIDFRASADFLLKVRSVVDARIVLVGDDVAAPAADGFTVWHLHDLGGHAAHDARRDAAPQRAAAHATPSPAITTPREAREQHLRDIRAQTTKDDVVEIIFTSGATAEPKGVVITHRNILANIVPIEREIVKYRRYARPFQPIRFLNLLPLSHMFGQAMATFVPPMLTGEVIFMRSYNPQEIMREIKTHRVSVLVSVPKLLDVLRDYVSRRFPHAATPDPAKMHFTKRWLKYRDVHRAFGWKFWSAVVGAAPLDPALEEYWGRLGFLVIQGYGLTETAPIVTLNHPFSAQKGSVGKPIHGVEVKIADDGEILVRGENVTTGYYGQPDATADAFEDGWLHTGDIGGLDETGRVFIRGRKKEMIVTPEGLNVFPEDVERELNAIAGVRESAVVGRNWQGEERVHAVLVVEPGHRRGRGGARREREAGRSSEDPQPRDLAVGVAAADGRHAQAETARDQELGGCRRRARRGDEARAGATSRSNRSSPASPNRAPDIGRDTTIDELGLSSLERVELLMALEDRFQTTLDEAAYAEVKTVGDLHLLVADAVGGAAGATTARLFRGLIAEAVSPRAPAPRSARVSKRGAGTGRARRAGRVPVVEPDAAGPRDQAGEPADVDSAAGAGVRVDRGERAGAPRRARGAGDVRGEPSEPPGRADDPVGPAARAGGIAPRSPWPRSSSRPISSPNATAARRGRRTA